MGALNVTENQWLCFFNVSRIWSLDEKQIEKNCLEVSPTKNYSNTIHSIHPFFIERNSIT